MFKLGLDIDVIEAVCDSINDKQDLLSLSLASSVLREIAIRHLLRSHTIYLRNRKAIQAFYAFIFSRTRKPNLAPHIHSLIIPPNTWFQVAPPCKTDLAEDVEHVIDILDSAVNLDTLDLSLRRMNILHGSLQLSRPLTLFGIYHSPRGHNLGIHAGYTTHC